MNNFYKTEKLLAAIDEQIRLKVPGPDYPQKTSLTPAGNDRFQIKMFIDILWSAVHILKTVIREESPDAIRIYTWDRNFGDPERRASWEAAESVYATVLSFPGWGIPVEIRRSFEDNNREVDLLPASSDGIVKKNLTALKKTGIRLIYSNRLLDSIIVGTRVGAAAALAVLWHSFARFKKRPVLVYGTGYPGSYNWDDALTDLYHAGTIPVFRITDAEILSRLKDRERYIRYADDVCKSLEELRAISSMWGIDACEFLKNRIARSVGLSITESLSAYTLCRQMIDKHKIRCLLISVRSSPPGNAVIQAAHDAGIPVVGWQHGAAGYCYHPMMAYIEYLGTDYHLVFGKGVAENYQKTLLRMGTAGSTIFLPAGSSSLDLLQKSVHARQNGNDKRSILYITTIYTNNRYYYSDRLNHSAFDETLWDIRKNILNLARFHEDLSFIIKLHPSETGLPALRQFLSDSGIRNVTVILNEKTIPDLIEESEIILFDLNSTGLLQALCTKKPVFVFTGLDNHDEDAISLLKRRAYVFPKRDQFIDAVDKYLTGTPLPVCPDCTNTDFLSMYGTFLNDGRSGERAAEILCRIINGIPVVKTN